MVFLKFQIEVVPLRVYYKRAIIKANWISKITFYFQITCTDWYLGRYWHYSDFNWIDVYMKVWSGFLWSPRKLVIPGTTFRTVAFSETHTHTHQSRDVAAWALSWFSCACRKHFAHVATAFRTLFHIHLLLVGWRNNCSTSNKYTQHAVCGPQTYPNVLIPHARTNTPTHTYTHQRRTINR